MIYSIKSDHAGFREVTFCDGLNIIVADITHSSQDKDSRNGLGKTLLIEIIHFCLGTNASKITDIKQLVDRTFIMELDLARHRITVKRNTAQPDRITIQGNTSSWCIQPQLDPEKQEYWLSENDWRTVLGNAMFDLPCDKLQDKYIPTYRSLISYFVRREPYAYHHPFENFSKQPNWSVQVNNAFLLGLAWEDASEWQALKEDKKRIAGIKKIIKSGEIHFAIGSRGELGAEKVRVQNDIDKIKEELASFRVHDRYHEIEKEANQLTQQIHQAVDSNITAKNLLELYRSNKNDEKAVDNEDIVEFYEKLKIEIPGMVKKRLVEVDEFHQKVIHNRKQFVAEEIIKLENEIIKNDLLIKERSDKRAGLLSIIERHGALEEYARLQNKSAELVAKLFDIEKNIDDYKKFDDKSSMLREKGENLYRRALRDYEDREEKRENAISIFNNNTERLYQVPGNLVIDINEKTGYNYKIEIQRAGSTGIDSMKTFCYDLMLAQLWAVNTNTPGFLIHDSLLFDGVDERQIASALLLAKEESTKKGFQYICTLNSDDIPNERYFKNLNIHHYIRLRLTDKEPSGSLLGIRY